jgi:hypothetical protein
MAFTGFMRLRTEYSARLSWTWYELYGLQQMQIFLTSQVTVSFSGNQFTPLSPCVLRNCWGLRRGPEWLATSGRAAESVAAFSIHVSSNKMSNVTENYSKFCGAHSDHIFASRMVESARDSSQVSEWSQPECFQPKESVCVVQQI